MFILESYRNINVLSVVCSAVLSLLRCHVSQPEIKSACCVKKSESTEITLKYSVSMLREKSQLMKYIKISNLH